VLAGWSVSSFYHISVTVQNRTHVHMNFYAQNHTYYHFPKYCRFLLNHPVSLHVSGIYMHIFRSTGCSLAASLLTWSRILWLLFISKSKISCERTPFWVNRRHPEGCNAGHKRCSTKCVPGMLQRIAAPLERVCVGTRDVLSRWIHRSWWINGIKLFYGTSLITLLSDLHTVFSTGCCGCGLKELECSPVHCV